jgi:hypothetical protein
MQIHKILLCDYINLYKQSICKQMFLYDIYVYIHIKLCNGTNTYCGYWYNFYFFTLLYFLHKRTLHLWIFWNGYPFFNLNTESSKYTQLVSQQKESGS